MNIKIETTPETTINYLSLNDAVQMLAVHLSEYPEARAENIKQLQRVIRADSLGFLSDFKVFFQEEMAKENNLNYDLKLSYSCEKECTPSDFHDEGMCGRNGCVLVLRQLVPQINPLLDLNKVANSVANLSEREELAHAETSDIVKTTWDLIKIKEYLEEICNSVNKKRTAS
ncbi:MAG: hypothetical protein CL843_01905 [Crocinitomicaceae bacterium]|nr:hypothetical protein [Crocinitomicaceae bacterium]